ncbi:methionyl-tRNA formyltransferase [Burkholderia anthina]|uniref:methionyl-tRNA formyltransferase n=1 Tax=Burkholderia anthina TaxID=179879 RepID=UPI00158E76F6
MYKTIIPATDWFFVHQGHNEPVVWPLAAWALKDNGETIGLIGAFGREQADKGQTPFLSPVVSSPGRYLHRSQLTKQERELAAKRGGLESAPVA